MIPTYTTYEGEAFVVSSGQWSWAIREVGGEMICGGAGYPDKNEAWQAMFDELSELVGEAVEECIL